MSERWDDLQYDGRRLARLIKFLETKLKHVKSDDPDSIVRYASTIGLLISKKIELIKTHTLSERLDKVEKMMIANKEEMMNHQERTAGVTQKQRIKQEVSNEYQRRGR